MLDVGAGVGTFTALAADAGQEVVALEPQPSFARLLERRFAEDARVRVVESPAENLPAELNGFDSVICFNVLEHIEDDVGALRAFRRALRPGGALLLLVPAHPRLFGATDRAIGHVRRYTRAAAAQALDAAGFRIETIRYVNPVGAVGWFTRVRLRGDEEWPATSFRVFDRLVPVLRPLDALRLPFGLSVWAVGRAELTTRGSASAARRTGPRARFGARASRACRPG